MIFGSTVVLGISAIAGAALFVIGLTLSTKDQTDVYFVGIGGIMFTLSGIGFAILATMLG